MDAAIIEGVKLVSLLEIGDSRGAVLHMLRNDSPDFISFGECYFSEVLPGVIKGWKKHHLQTQNLAVPVGRIRIVMFDERIESSTKGLVQVVELGRPDAYIRVTIPPGIWYAFSCISSEKGLLVNCADIPHQSSESETMPLEQSSIPYKWQK
jgi:dTDP-4-dehydrorhamnose 3,5-epimerase